MFQARTMHPPPYYAVHPHAMVHHHHHHHLMQVCGTWNDEKDVESNGNANCRLIFLPSSHSSTSTRTCLPQTPRYVFQTPHNKTQSHKKLHPQAPAGPPTPTSAASRYPAPASQHRNPQFTSLEVIIGMIIVMTMMMIMMMLPSTSSQVLSWFWWCCR